MGFDVGGVDRDRVAVTVGAAKLTSSRMRSVTVCRRRAPMVSMLALIETAIEAIESIASSVTSSVTSGDSPRDCDPDRGSGGGRRAGEAGRRPVAKRRSGKTVAQAGHLND